MASLIWVHVYIFVLSLFTLLFLSQKAENVNNKSQKMLFVIICIHNVVKSMHYDREILNSAVKHMHPKCPVGVQLGWDLAYKNHFHTP